MRVFDWLFKRRVWRHKGTVKGVTDYTIDGESIGRKSICFWVLRESDDGIREFKKIGDGGGSEYAKHQEAAVTAWVYGGPLPKLENLGNPLIAEPPKPKSKAKLLVFNGGKSDEIQK